MRKMKAMKKVLAGLLAAVIMVTSVAPVYAADPDPNPPTNSTWKPPYEDPVDGEGMTGIQPDGTKTEVNTSSNGTATLTEVKKTNKTTVKVGQKVTVDGVSYTVTEIGANAFKECAKMKNVTLPSTIETIAKNAFKGAASLTTAEIKGKPVVKAGAFNGAKNLKTVTFTSAATLEKNAFKGTPKLSKMTFKGAATFKSGALKGATGLKTMTVSGNATFKKGSLNGAKLNKMVVSKKAVFNAGSFTGASVGKLTVNKNATFKKNAFKGADTKKATVTVSGKMTEKQYDNFVKMMRAAGFKGTIKKA